MFETINYRLDQFEGPLDLLLTLIKKNKVNITDIPIALICDQYVEYIENAKKMDLEVASEFIVMASELMLIKSRMLLPHEEGTENDPRREIADALRLYQQAKWAAKELAPMYAEFGGRFVKGTDDVPPEKGLPLNLQTDMLMKALNAVMRRMKIAMAERKPADLVNPLIKHHVVSVEEKIEEICMMLADTGEASLYDLLSVSPTRADLVARFMGILELIKIGRILITTTKIIEDVVEYESLGIHMRFILNNDYIPPAESTASEFDTPPASEEKKEEDKQE
ncbi:MAG: segregation/condensation protein A [Clostridia bacterium]|nr:segregation/condensation protein A [Clostridia bacterium]MBR2324844.1 segregation/condensation protein A [Clostridia bacterium]